MSEYLDDRAFLAALPVAFKELEGVAHEEQKALAGRIRDKARFYAPVAGGAVPAGETPGELRDHIEVTEGIEGDSPYVEVGVRTSDVPYANYVEWGTSKMSARHFMLPAIAMET